MVFLQKLRQALIILPLLSLPVSAMADEVKTLPFTKEENQDGARWVWFIYKQAGCSFRYLKADTYPDSKQFRELDSGEASQSGDVAWWPHFVSIYNATQHTYMNAEGPVAEKLLNAQLGKPSFFRFQRKPNSKSCG